MTEIAGYRLGRVLGRGAFGETFEATKNGQRVAFKLMHEEAMRQGFDVRRFEREVRALQKAVGPNVVKLIDAGTTQLGNETRYYVVLEYLGGKDLERAFRDEGRNFDEQKLKDVLCQIVAGLKTIHDQNIVHRDLKPANVFLTTPGEVKLLDFGLVKMLDYTSLTMRGQPVGTPLYMAPEILRGERVDHRADFYSLGVLMYYLLTGGHHPFTAPTPLELFVHVVNDPPASPTGHNRSLSSEFENLILLLLSKQPYERTLNHAELTRAINSTPISVSAGLPSRARARGTVYPKRCLIRVLHNEKGTLGSFAEEGGAVDGIVFQANYVPRYSNSLTSYSNLGIEYLFDPLTYRLTYSSFAQTQSLVDLPYVIDRNSRLTPEALQTLRAIQDYSRRCLDWQLQWNCSTLVAPFHFCRDLGSSWVDIDVKLLEESITYARTANSSLPVYAGLCLNIEFYTVQANRLALLNRYSRARPDGYLFYVDSMNERTSNPLQLRSFLDVLKLFQRLGKPVFACRVGTLGLGLLAAGVDGMTTGIASLSSFSESNLLANRQQGYDMRTKYYIPGTMLTLPVAMAQDILADRRNVSLRCNCPHCQGAHRNLARVAKAHFLHRRTEEIAELNALPDTTRRIAWFLQRVEAAVQVCDNIKRQQVVNLQAGHYLHLRTWQDVFGTLQGGTP